MPLTEITLLDENNYNFFGRELYFELEGTNDLDLQSTIDNDIAPFWANSERYAVSCRWRLVFNILEYDLNNIQSYKGYPSRYRFGGYTFRNADCYDEYNFINFTKQTSKFARTWFAQGIVTNSLIFPPALAPLTSTTIEHLGGLARDNTSPIAQSVAIDFNTSVIADVYIDYAGTFYNENLYDYYSQRTFLNL